MNFLKNRWNYKKQNHIFKIECCPGLFLGFPSAFSHIITSIKLCYSYQFFIKNSVKKLKNLIICSHFSRKKLIASLNQKVSSCKFLKKTKISVFFRYTALVSGSIRNKNFQYFYRMLLSVISKFESLSVIKKSLIWVKVPIEFLKSRIHSRNCHLFDWQGSISWGFFKYFLYFIDVCFRKF